MMAPRSDGAARKSAAPTTGFLLMMPRTCDVAVSRSRDSLSSRVSSAILFLSLVAGIGLGEFRRSRFVPVRGLVFPRVFRPVVTQSP